MEAIYLILTGQLKTPAQVQSVAVADLDQEFLPWMTLRVLCRYDPLDTLQQIRIDCEQELATVSLYALNPNTEHKFSGSRIRSSANSGDFGRRFVELFVGDVIATK